MHTGWTGTAGSEINTRLILLENHSVFVNKSEKNYTQVKFDAVN